jgi:colanic acid/amylovoran biosynthesis protein
MVLDNTYDTYMQQYIIAQCYATIGMRYHSNIFAAKGCKPFIAIAYEEKMIGFMQEHHLNEYMIPLQSLDSDTLINRFDSMVANYDSYQKQLLDSRESFRANAQETADAIINFLNNR